MRPTLRWLTLVCLTALALSACGLTRTPAAPLRLGLNIWSGFTPFYGAAKRQLYSSTAVEITTFSSLYDADRAFSQGRIDAVGTTLFDALRLADEGTPLKIVMVTDYSNGADGIVARQGIASVAELKGKRVAVEIGAINHFVLLRALDRAGLQERDLDVVNLSVEEGAKALTQGKVDAAALWEPFLSQQVSAGGAHTLFTSSEIPGEVIDVLVVRSDLAEQRPADVANLVGGWEQALRIVQQQPQAMMGDMAQAMNTTPEGLQSDLAGLELIDLSHNQHFFDPASRSPSAQATYAATVTFMIQHQLLKQAAPAAGTLFDAQFVAAALAKWPPAGEGPPR
jgi:NitT/TauT family transport system substrate-binding protein